MEAIITPLLQGVVAQALRYLRCGLPVHFCGPAGTGKTTLAVYVAGLLNRPVTVLRGDEEMTTSSLVGGVFGLRHRRVVDNFIHSVLKEENEFTEQWQEERLTEACREGHTLVYDEFTRSRPEANNVLLTVLEEGVLPVSGEPGRKAIPVHPEFRAIFTSNPDEYAGVHKAQDALRDRMVTIRLDYHDADTETAITAARSGLSEDKARRVVELVRRVRQQGGGARVGLRASVFLARFVHEEGIDPDPAGDLFHSACIDILAPAVGGTEQFASMLRELSRESSRVPSAPADPLLEPKPEPPPAPDDPAGRLDGPGRNPRPAGTMTEVGEARTLLLRRGGGASVPQW